MAVCPFLKKPILYISSLLSVLHHLLSKFQMIILRAICFSSIAVNWCKN
jgi:hypothetical protein